MAQARTTRARLATGVAAVSVLAALLSGCGIGDQASERATERLLERGMEEGSSGKVDVDVDGEEVTIESSEGTFSSGGSVPEDFPSDVPLAEGTVLMSSSTGKGWSVMLEIDGDFAEVAPVAMDAIVQAGFIEESRTTSAEYAALTTTGDEYDVMLTAAPGDAGGTTLSYVVVIPE